MSSSSRTENEVLIAIQEGDLDRARLALSAAIGLPHASAGSYAALGAFLLDRGELRFAADVLDRARVIDPKSLRVALLRSVALERLGMIVEAKAQADEAATIDHLAPAVLRQLGRLAARLGDRRGCVDAFRNLVELTGARDRQAMSALGIALSEAGRHEDAIRVLTRAVELEPREPAAHADLGMAFYSAGRFDEATKTFAHALQLAPGCAQAHLGLGLSHARHARWTDAASELRTAARLAPSAEVAHFNLGLALEANGDLLQARASLLRAAALAPNDMEIGAALDRVLTVLGVSGSTNPIDARAALPDHKGGGTDARSITGDIETFPLENLLEFLRVQTKSGRLTVLAPGGAGVVRLHEGWLVSAMAPKSKRLGEMLLERKLLQREQFERALLEQRSMAGDSDAASCLGAIVLRHGWMKEDTLRDVVREQIIEALSEILDWKEGTFTFQAEAAEEAPAITFDVQYLTLELFRRRDENRERKLRLER